MQTLLILHGWQSSGEKWQKVKEYLEKEGIRVITPDLPGFKQENQLTRAWDLDDYVNWVEQFIKNNTSDPIFLLGHSFGGRIAIKFAAKHPEKLSGLILVSAAGITPRPKIKIKIFWVFAKIGHLIFSLPILKLFRSYAKKVVYFLAGETDYRFAQQVFLKETFKKVISENLVSLLPQIRTQTLMIWGEKDKMTPLEDAHIMKGKIKGSELEVLDDIGHFSYLESPELLSKKIIEFLKSHERVQTN